VFVRGAREDWEAVMAFRHGVLGEKEEGMELTAVFKS
jgi:hypothetical protein